MALFRKSWARVSIVVTAIVAVNTALIFNGSDDIRVNALRSLQSSALLFAVCIAVSLALFTNYVKGIRDSFLNRSSKIRDMLEKIFDEFKDTEDPDVKEIIDRTVVPLLNMTTDDWIRFVQANSILERLTDPLTRLHERDKSFIPRYFLRVEDEMRELAKGYIRIVASSIHVETVSGAFYLVTFGILCIGLSFAVPVGQMGDLVIASATTAIVSFGAIELLLILSYLRQEAREEGYGVNSDETDDA